jgi:hypothetical protein
MRDNPLTQRVNFYISASFILVFGLFMTTKILDFAHADDPITNAVAATQAALNQ